LEVALKTKTAFLYQKGGFCWLGSGSRTRTYDFCYFYIKHLKPL